MAFLDETGATIFADEVKTYVGNTAVAKETGKGLSTNDYTITEKNKLAGIAEGANKTIVDSALDVSSENPVQNKVVKEQIDALTTQINNAIALRSSLEQYGMAKLSNSAAVTDSTGLALPATEKNATIDGTLANQISQLNTNLNTQIHHYVVPKETKDCPNGEYIIIGSNSGLYLIYYSWNIHYSFDLVAVDDSSVRIISQNNEANIAYWKVENSLSLYATNNTGYDLSDIGIFKVIY